MPDTATQPDLAEDNEVLQAIIARRGQSHVLRRLVAHAKARAAEQNLETGGASAEAQRRGWTQDAEAIEGVIRNLRH